MKEINNGFVILLTGLLLVASPDLSMSGGDYEISWSTINGGGGKSAGGGYTVFATIGQSIAGDSSGGSYDVSGGFWAGVPLDIVDFEHFARFATYWLDTPCDTGNNWCGGADLNHLNGVDWVDVNLFTYEWLYYCPLDWPLK